MRVAEHMRRHEHLYKGALERTLIRSDQFGKGLDVNRAIGDTRIMLCTLSMLSNPVLDLFGVFRYRPVEVLIVDEASQIDTLEFMVSWLHGGASSARSCCIAAL